MSFFLSFPTLLLLPGDQIQIIAELTLAMEKWVSMRKTGCDRPMVDLGPCWGVWGQEAVWDREVPGLDNVVIPRTHEGSVTSCFSSCRENTLTHMPEIHHAEYLRLPDTHNTHTACSALLAVQRSPQDSPRSPFLPVLLFLFLPQHTHTFRSTSLVPLEQVMITQGGSAAMATPSATSSLPTPAFNPVVGPWQE